VIRAGNVMVTVRYLQHAHHLKWAAGESIPKNRTRGLSARVIQFGSASYDLSTGRSSATTTAVVYAPVSVSGVLASTFSLLVVPARDLPVGIVQTATI